MDQETRVGLSLGLVFGGFLRGFGYVARRLNPDEIIRNLLQLVAPQQLDNDSPAFSHPSI